MYHVICHLSWEGRWGRNCFVGFSCITIGFTCSAGEGPLTFSMQRFTTCTVKFNRYKADGYITLAAGASFNSGSFGGYPNFDGSCSTCQGGGATNFGVAGMSVFAASTVPVGGMGSAKYGEFPVAPPEY
jgi:hypothetical protein